MHSSLVQSRPKYRLDRRSQKKYRPGFPKSRKVDAATLASTLQLQEQKQELIYSFIALTMKLGLVCLSALSLVKLGLASHQRIERHAELASVLEVESARLANLQQRFDSLFTIGGDRRLMDEQDHWIEPNRVRVIWQ